MTNSTALKCPIKPTGKKIVAKKKEAEEKTAGGILLPEGAKEKSQQAEVLAIGPGEEKEDGKLSGVKIKVGETILYPKYSGSEVKINGEEYLIIDEKEVLAIIEN